MNYKTRNRIQTFVIGDPILPGDGGDLGGGTEPTVFDLPENYYLEKDKYVENPCGSRNVQRVNLRTGKLYVNQFVHGVSGNRLPFNLALTYNPNFKDDTEIFGNQELTNTAGKLPFKGWKFNYQQYVRKQNDKYYYYDADFMLHVFAKCQNSSYNYYDSTGQTGMLLSEIRESGIINEIVITDGKNVKLHFSSRGDLIKITEKKGATASETLITYDDSFRISTVTDGAGRVFTFTYDLEKVTLTRTDLEQTQTIAELYFGVSDSSQLARIKDCKSLQNIEFDYSTNWGLYGITNGVEQESVEMIYVNSPKVYQISNYKGVGESRQLRQNVCIVEYENNESKKMVQSVVYTENNVQLTQRTYYYFAQNGELIFSLPHAYSQDQAVLNKVNTFFTTHTFANAKVFSGCEVILTQDPVFEFKKSGANMQVNASEIKESDEISVPLSNPTKALLVAKIVSSNTADDGTVRSDLSKVDLVVNDNISHTINFVDSDKIFKSTVVSLPAGGSVKLKASIMNFSSNSITAEVALYPFTGTEQKEVISENNIDESLNAEVCTLAGINWYEPKKCNIYFNETPIENVEFTYRDYMLTLISYFKNSSSFTAWYNDGKNALAGCTLSTLEYLFRTDGSGSKKQLTDFKYAIYQKGLNSASISYAIKDNSYLKSVTETTLLDSSVTTFTKLDSYFRPVTQQDANDIITAYSYDDYGNCTQKKVYPSSDTSKYITQNYTYTNGDQLASEKEYREISTFTTSYNYDADGKLIKVTTPKGQVINYTHEEGAKDYTIMQTTLNGENLGNRVLSEKNGLPIWVDSYNADITFAYDKFNNVNRVFNNEASLYNVNTVYEDVSGAGYTEIIYGTTDKKERRYFNKYGHVYKISVLNGENWEDVIYFIYSDEPVSDDVTSPSDSSLKPSANSKLRKVVDKTSLNVYNIIYNYDALGRLSGTIDQGTTSDATCDNQNRPIHIHTGISTSNSFVNNNRTLQYSSDFDNALEQEETDIYYNKLTTLYAKDGLNRPTSTTVKDDANNGYKVTYEYYPKEYKERVPLPPIISPGGTIIPGGFQIVTTPDGTTGYIQTVTTYNINAGTETLSETETVVYDANGNITQYGGNTYVYDNLNRLTRENNADLQQSFTYEYDIHGNLTVKKEYAYTTATLGAATATKTFTYDSNNRLITNNGSAVSYDRAGNVTSFGGKTFNWKGKQLSLVTSSSGIYEIYYDLNGQIKDIKKGAYGRTLRHASGQIVYENPQLCEMFYVYNQQGVAGFYWRNNMSLDFDDGFYTFRKNIFGDVTEIYQGSNCVAKYKYDAWGNCTVYDQNDEVNTSIDFIGNINPFRYRGYYWCEELQMYYLQTRWYDPTIGRFISPDSYEYLAPETFGGLNLYAYCLNNPIMYTDPTGHAPKWLQGLAIGLTILGVALVAGAITVLTAGTGWAFMATTMAGAALHSAAIGTLIGAGVGIVGGAIVGGALTDWSVEGVLTGAGIGFGALAFAGALIGAAVGSIQYTSAANSWYGGKEEMIKHFNKHGVNMGYKNVIQYTKGAKNVIKNGVYLAQKNAYSLLYQSGKYLFTGVAQGGNLITTFGIRTFTKTAAIALGLL